MRKVIAALMLGGMLFGGLIGLRYIGSVPANIGFSGAMQEAAGVFSFGRRMLGERPG